MTTVPPDAIAEELRVALLKLGAREESLAGIDWNDNTAVLAIAESHHAGFELLCAIGSRGDTLSDDQVLRYLQGINGNHTR